MGAGRIKEQHFCGCCGREIAGGFFCADCGPHLGSSRLPPEERTYFAQHGRECPFQIVTMECPRCGAVQEDHDGFGVVACAKCGYCTHPSRTGDICGICKKRVTTCGECGGRGWHEGNAGIDRGAECGACGGDGVIVEEVSGEQAGT